MNNLNVMKNNLFDWKIYLIILSFKLIENKS